MSPSPALSKPPPSHLALLMNPTPDTPKDDNHMIIPEIYESKPGFLTQSQHNSQPNILAIILQNLENLENKETNTNLPANLETLITFNNSKKEQGPSNKQVSPSHSNQPTGATTQPSFAAITAGTRSMNKQTLPRRLPPEICQNHPQETNRFKKYHIVIRSKFGTPKPFEKISLQEACSTINKVLIEINATCNNTPIGIRAFKQYQERKLACCWRTGSPGLIGKIHSCPTYEPWTNLHTWLPLTHQNWHRLTSADTPKRKEDKPHACIYINK
ncbi:hypothetical protein O181_046310 [Austropuccinia psidii MF-1]|uniref:Uncharacterized protein n=1 Tax=Austropuccinia psidii MF-1 TaxID=1389203 RepID=A0A9Q3DN91_9BASI|nr:hypothetical protein [Austropuccinia psidii MF-1]